MEQITQPQVRWEWIGEGWQMFVSQWQTWVLQALIYFAAILVPIGVIYSMIIGFVIATVPQPDAGPASLPIWIFPAYFLIYLVMAVISAYLVGGIYNTALKQLRGERISVGDLFSGGEHFGRLLIATILVGIMALIGMMLCFIPGLIVIGLFFFTYPLIIDRKLSATDAMRTSYEFTKQNILMFTLFAIVVYFLAQAGSYLCGIGVLMTWPLLFTISAVAYRDCFGVEGAQSFTSSSPGAAPSYANQPWQTPPPPPLPATPPPPIPQASEPRQTAEQPQSKLCPTCGASLTRAANFCNFCGNRL